MSKFEQLMDKIRKSRDEACQLQEELERKLSDRQSNITFAQEKVSHELAQEMSKSAYQFRHTSFGTRGTKDSLTLMPVSRSH